MAWYHAARTAFDALARRTREERQMDDEMRFHLEMETRWLMNEKNMSEEEARLAYRAATSELGIGGGSRAVFDTGGGSTQFSFGDADAVDALVARARPSLILLPAAQPNVGRCETEAAESERINVEGTRNAIAAAGARSCTDQSRE